MASSSESDEDWFNNSDKTFQKLLNKNKTGSGVTTRKAATLRNQHETSEEQPDYNNPTPSTSAAAYQSIKKTARHIPVSYTHLRAHET